MRFKTSKYNLNVGLTAIAVPASNVDGTGFILNERAKYTALTGMAAMSVANSNLDGTGTLYLVLTATSNGTLIKTVTIKGSASSAKGMVRLFVKVGRTTTLLLAEIEIPYASPTGTAQSFSKIVELGVSIGSGNQLYASTQKADLINVIVEGLSWTY